MAKIENIKNIENLVDKSYNSIDLSILNNNIQNANIELTVFDSDNNLINSSSLNLSNEINNTIYITDTKLLINPGVHLRNLGYTSGKYSFKYKFFLDIFGSHLSKKNFSIKEISPSRQEIKALLLNNNIDENNLKSFINSEETKRLDSYINFENNLDYILLNIIKDNKSNDKLYRLRLLNKLDNNIVDLSSFWISKKILDDYEDSIVLLSENKPDLSGLNILQGPNIQHSNIGNILGGTTYESFDSLTEATNSLDKNKIISFYLSSSLSSGKSNLNIEYRIYDNFIHFSSAEDRLKKFKYKLDKIEYYDQKISNTSLITSSSNLYEVSSSIQLYKKYKFDLINTFDDYEKFMYYDSSSYESGSLGIFPDFSWPKYNSTYPYSLYSTTSSEAITWYTNQLYSASIYDSNNQDKLTNTVPILMLEDSQNDDYIKFINMVGHQLDITYNYINNIDNIFNMENSINKGTPKDLINDLLYNFGMDIVGGYNEDNLEEVFINSGSDINFSITGSHI